MERLQPQNVLDIDENFASSLHCARWDRMQGQATQREERDEEHDSMVDAVRNRENKMLMGYMR
jgi:hypothetical protein